MAKRPNIEFLIGRLRLNHLLLALLGRGNNVMQRIGLTQGLGS